MKEREKEPVEMSSQAKDIVLAIETLARILHENVEDSLKDNWESDEVKDVERIRVGILGAVMTLLNAARDAVIEMDKTP